LSIRDYLHEKAEESRHNEMFAYLMFIAGAVFFVGGILETLTTSSAPDWFLFFPYHFTPEPSGILGLALTLCGLTLIGFGVGMGLYYAHDRSWYMKELYNSHSAEATSMSGKKRKRRNHISTAPI